MGKSLNDIAVDISKNKNYIQLIYAFNGTGKTRLSNEFKKLIDCENNEAESLKRILYFNSFTEDLFSWVGSFEDQDIKLKISKNAFTDWILKDQGQDQNVITYFQNFWNKNVEIQFNNDFSEVTFSIKVEDEGKTNIKISKGEESGFVWSLFFCLLKQVTDERLIAESSDRDTNDFDDIEYIFIDDPVSSLDDNNLIQLAVDVAELFKKCKGLNIKFIVTTHSPVFYNVLMNEYKNISGFFLENFSDGTFELQNKVGDSNTAFSYHLHLKRVLQKAISENNIQRYHFTILRNLYEKTASFLGYKPWSILLPDDKRSYFNRIIQFTSHSTLEHTFVAEPNLQEKEMIKFLLKHLIDNYKFWKEENNE